MREDPGERIGDEVLGPVVVADEQHGESDRPRGVPFVQLVERLAGLAHISSDAGAAPNVAPITELATNRTQICVPFVARTAAS
jgi:hypothetical protein